MRKRTVIILLLMVLASPAAANTIKVLILDDIFQTIPGVNEKIEKMGKLRGDLLVNGTHYLGDIEIWRSDSGMYLINELPLEEYVKNVVGAEVGPNWEMEALKAQAVISRTYALFQKKYKSGVNFDLTSSVLHQVYKGNSPDERIAHAVRSTKGEVLLYDGNLIEALYHSTCGGRTEDPADVFEKSYPYLKPVESSCELSPYWLWEKSIPVPEIENALNVSGIKNISPQAYSSTKRVKTVKIVHDAGTLSMKTNELRKLLGWSRLPSTNFSVKHVNGNYVFEGRGYGHGVGLCQWSALEMAKKGKTYREILSFFYPGTTLGIYEDR